MLSLSTAEITMLSRLLTRQNLQVYLHAASNRLPQAFHLYNWNLELSGAFLVVIAIGETILRNAIAEAIGRVHGPEWPWSQGFRQSLIQPRERREYSSLQDLKLVADTNRNTSDVVNNLKFAFTESMLTKSQHHRLWAHQLFQIFPGIPRTQPIEDSRPLLHRQVRHMRLFRNRVAHQQPIFQRNLQEDYDIIRSLAGYRDPLAREWVSQIETITPLLASGTSILAG